jgi:hypothetical protein
MELIDVDGVAVPFSNRWNIAVSLSGGADSALLAYLLCSRVVETQTVHIINHTRMWKTRPWQQYDVVRVYDWLFDRFPDVEFVLHKNFIAPELEYGKTGPCLTDEYGKQVSGDNIQQRAYAEYICNKHHIDAYYNAVTCNPTVDLGGMKERDIVRTKDNAHLEFMIHDGRYACHPFRFVNKAWVVKQYRRLDIMDLFNVTRSCEGEIDGLDYHTYTPGQEVAVCGKCFWCKEREWAIESSTSAK